MAANIVASLDEGSGTYIFYLPVEKLAEEFLAFVSVAAPNFEMADGIRHSRLPFVNAQSSTTWEHDSSATVRLYFPAALPTVFAPISSSASASAL